MTMIRKQFFIDRAMSQRVKQLAAERGVSEAELIREAIEQKIASAANDTVAWRQTFRHAISLCEGTGSIADRVASEKARQSKSLKKRLDRNRQRLDQA
jgi:Ribbon-helix-helix protein, copG family